MKRIIKAVVLAPLARRIDDQPQVSVIVEIRDSESPLNGRQVLHTMTLDMARRRAAELLAAVAEAERLSAEVPDFDAERDDDTEPCGESHCRCDCDEQHGPCGCDCPRDDYGQLITEG